MNCTTQNDTPFQAEKLPEYPPHYVEYMQYNAGVRLKEGEPPPGYDDLLEAVQTPLSPYLWPPGLNLVILEHYDQVAKQGNTGTEAEN